MAGDTQKTSVESLDRVKVDLAIILVLAVLLLLWVEELAAGLTGQLLLLGGYGVLGTGWVVARTRRVMRNVRASAHDP